MGNLQKQAKNIAEAIVELRDDFKEALIEKGVSDPGDNIAEYPSKILDIPASGGPVDWTRNRVRFFNFDGTLISEQYVEDGAAAVLPENPTAPEFLGLTFVEWSVAAADLQHVYCNLDAVAMYRLTSADSPAIALRVNVAAGETLTLPVYDGSEPGFTVKWTEDSEAVAPPASLEHQYESDYEGYVLIYTDRTKAVSISGSDTKITDILVFYFNSATDSLSVANLSGLHGIYIGANETGTAANVGLSISQNVRCKEIRRIVVTGAQSVSISYQNLTYLIVPDATISQMTGIDVDVLYNRASLSLPSGYSAIRTLALTYSGEFPGISYVYNLKQVYFPNITAYGEYAQPLFAENTANAASIEKVAVNIVSGVVPTARYVFSLRSLILINNEVNPAISLAVYRQNFVADASSTSLENLVFVGVESISYADGNTLRISAPNLTDMELWADLFGLLSSESTYKTIRIATRVYNQMPDEVKAIATAKGWSITDGDS